nr:bromodomain adjacent to zinc finger domain [Hymenolepis microstoma]
MPLLNGELFVKKQPPADLRPEEEVFFSSITYELFRDYDEFFERTIQLNSEGWGCSFCGHQNLNYNEAVACEAGDAARLAEFGPAGLCRGLLHIILGAKRRRMNELVDVMLAFASSRYFIGEELCVRNTDSNAAATEIPLDPCVTVQQVILPQPKAQTVSQPRPTMPESKLIQYAVRHLPTKTNPTPVRTLCIMPYTALQRPPQRYLTRDKIRNFIRQTAKLENGIFVPRESVMKYFDVYPHGTLKWSNFFAGSVLPWSDFVFTRVVTGREGVPTATHGNTTARKSSAEPVVIKAITNSVEPPIVSQAHNIEFQHQMRVDRAELERVWSFLRKRDDLDLSDLVPLPPMTPLSLRSPIPPEHFGDCLRIYEFFHALGGFLHIPLPGVAQSVVRAVDGSTSTSSKTGVIMIENEKVEHPNDQFSWKVLEDILFDQDPSGPFADILYGLLNAIRRLENEASAKLPPTAEAAAAATVSAIATLEAGLPVASAGTLTGLGCSQEYTTILAETLTSPANARLASIFRATAEATRQCELVGLAPINTPLTSRVERAAAQVNMPLSEVSGWSCGPGPGSAGRSMAVRASALAIALGAISLPPLDRAGLAEALWLHINTAPAKTGGWRGSIWGGTRPLDDPCVDLMRNDKELVDRLRSEPLYGWPLGDRLRLLNCLMDEVLMQPQVRELLDSSSEDIKNLRLNLRGVQAERFRFYGGNSGIANMFYGFSASTLVSTCDHWLTGTPPILRNSTNRPRKKTVEAAKAKIAKEFNEARASVTGTKLTEADLYRMPPIADVCAHLDKEEENLWRSVVRKARRFSIIPLGQDRIYRRYWLVPSLPAVLIENTMEENETAPPIHIASPTKLISGNSQLLRVRGKQVAPGYGVLGSTPAEAVKNLRKAAKEMRATAEAEDEHWQNPRILDRDSLVSQLAVDMPTNRDTYTNEEFKALVHPNRRANAQVDADHPVIKQVEELQKNPPKWSVLLPIPASDQDEGEEDDENHNSHPDDRYAGARRAIDQLEASLNSRGIREAHLRKSISQLRPILISTVAKCPVDILAVSEEEKTIKPKIVKNPQTTMVAWLEQAIRGVAMRLGVPFSKLEQGVQELQTNEEETKETSKVLNDSVKGVKLNADDFNKIRDDEIQNRKEVRRLAQLILALGKSVGSKRLAAPLSSDDRSLRGAKPSNVNLASLDDPNSSASITLPSQAPVDMPAGNGATTGFRRWVTCVRSATTTAQLHLLLRSLERSARKANKGGRGVPAAIGSYAARFQLPEIRCTACRGTPDEATGTNSRGMNPFTLCGGCACPFHPDCLINSLSRQKSRTSLRNATLAYSRGAYTPDLDVLDNLSTTYSLMSCHINTTAAARQDTLKGALLLCQRCRRLATVDADGEEMEKYADPLPDEIVEVEVPEGGSGDGMEEELGGVKIESDNQSGANSNADENEEMEQVKMETEIESEDNYETVTISRSASVTPRRGGRPQVAKRGSLSIRGRSSRGSLSLRGTSTSNTGHSSGHRGRPAKRPRYLEDYDGGDDFDYEQSTPINSKIERIAKEEPVLVAAEHGDENTAPIAVAGTIVLNAVDDQDVLYEDEVHDLSTRRSRGRRGRGGWNLRGTGRHSAGSGTPRRRGRPPKRGGATFMLNRTVSSILHASDGPVVIDDDDKDNDTAAAAAEEEEDNDVEMVSEVAKPPQPLPLRQDTFGNPIQTQAAAERLLADISALSAARPLLRCALSKTLQSVELPSSDKEELSPSRKNGCTRRQPTKQQSLLAYDLDSLKDLLTSQSGLPGGPSQIVSQLKMLTQHWITSNRPGSRLHGCALDVSTFLEKKLRELAANSSN